MAGIVGVDPAPFKLRELRDMAHGRMKHEWEMTSKTIARLINVQLTGNAELHSDDEFSPFRESDAGEPPAAPEGDNGIDLLKCFLPKGG